MVIVWTFWLALLVLVQSHRLSPQLLDNFEQNLFDEYSANYATGSYANVADFLAQKSGGDLLQRIGEFAKSFRRDDSQAASNRRGKRETPGYFGALLDSSK